MPNYDFACNHCGFEEEKRVPFSERQNQVCPKCGHGQIVVWKKAPGVVFRGFFPSANFRKEKELREFMRESKEQAEAERKERHRRWAKDPPFKVIEGQALREHIDQVNETTRAAGLKGPFLSKKGI